MITSAVQDPHLTLFATAAAFHLPSLVSMVPSSLDGDQQSAPTSVVTPARTDDSRWIYRMEVARELPQVNLDETPISMLLSPASHDKFLDTMRRHYAHFSSLYRLSGAFLLTVLFVPREIGYWLSAPALFMSIPAMTCSALMNCTDMYKLLVRQYEFWFFTIMNTINWLCLASFYSDARCISLFGGIFGTQMVIIMDANFRTVTSAIRSTTVATPVLLALGIAAFFRVIDTDASNYRTIPVARVTVSFVDVFTNTALTLAIFVARKGYSKRKVLITRSAEMQTIRCVVFRSKLQLRKIDLPPGVDRTLAATLSGSLVLVSQPSIVNKLMHMNASPLASPRVTIMDPSFASSLPTIPINTARDRIVDLAKHPHVSDIHEAEATTKATNDDHSANANAASDSNQQLTLVSMQVSTVDVRQTVAPRLTPLATRMPKLLAQLLYIVGVLGFVCTSITLTAHRTTRDRPTTAQWTVAILAISCTAVFFATFAVSYHRVLLKSLCTNFDFLFSSVQFSLAMLLISDMVTWDFRVCGTMAWLLWFHFVLLLDALTPVVKHNLWFKKHYALPVILLTLTNVVLIIYAFFFADASTYFIDRTVWEVEINGKTFGLRTKSLLLNRLFTIILWSCRLVYEVAACDDCELIFIRGGLDYFTTMEMFPPLQPPRSSHESTKRMWFGRKAVVEPVSGDATASASKKATNQ